MLSEETAAGQYPVEAVMMMDRIVRTAEGQLDPNKFEKLPELKTVGDALTRSSYYIAREIESSAIITPTLSGSTPRLVARFRPKQAILAPTSNPRVLHFLALCWGVSPFQVSSSESTDDMVRFSIDAALRSGHIERGQSVIITSVMPLHVPGATNFIKVQRVE
jgi:pyruvate kinase